MVKHFLSSIMAQSDTLVARGAVGLSFGSTAFAYIERANIALTFVATIIAIVSGLFAIRFYYLRSKHLTENHDESGE